MYGWMTTDEIAAFLAPFYPSWDAPPRPEISLQGFDAARACGSSICRRGGNVRLGLCRWRWQIRPGLVILDDPAMGLDPITRKQFNRDVIEHLQSEGRDSRSIVRYLLYEVRRGHAVAILDQGRLVGLAATDELQSEVKRVVRFRGRLAGRRGPRSCSTSAETVQRVAVTLDDSAEWIAALRREGVEHVVEDLSLDEIFEAFVIGRVDLWPMRCPSWRRPSSRPSTIRCLSCRVPS